MEVALWRSCIKNHYNQNNFKRQVLASNALIHYLLPERHDSDTIRSLRKSQLFLSIRARTNKFQKSFVPYCLRNYIVS